MGLIYIDSYRNSATTLWTPAQITTALWLDALDASTFTLNGSLVTQHRDKSGNGRHANASGGIEPTLSNQTVSFPGSKYMALVNNLGTASQNGFTMVAIGASNAVLIGSADQCLFQLVGNTQWRNSGGTGYAVASGGVAAVEQISSWRQSGTSMSQWKNGTLSGSATGSSTTWNYTASTFWLFRGDGSAGGTVSVGSYREIVAVNSALSDADLWRLEGYIAHHTSKAELLRADHPYKSSPP